MKKLFGVFRQRWFVSLLGLLALALLIWYAGPLIAIAGHEPLAEELERLIAIAALFLIWGLRRLHAWWVARRNSTRMAAELVAAAIPPPGESAAAAEVGVLRERLEEALAVLKKAGRGGRLWGSYLYQLPWYILIGPPGAGKTTALLNSGLHFPLAERFGNAAIGGVGGTRNCDWWFTDEAVLLDTAGRYTTQDSHQELDKTAWQGFLSLLKKYRPRRPINGALLAVSVADLLRQSEAERSLMARTLRQRVQELHEQLGIRFPLYVLLTKCDLLAGFVEFFEDLGREERAQVWGMTFPLEESGAAALRRLPAEFAALEERLHARLLERLQQERDPQRRALIYGFPQQFAVLVELLAPLLDEVFRASRFEAQPLLRGVYFTSGTQEGTPIDRLLSGLAATFGLERQALAAFSGSGRSYFLTRLLREVIFREQGLAGTDLRLERRRAWLQGGAWTAALACSALAAGAWYASYSRNQDYVAALDAQVKAITGRLAALPSHDPDLTPVLPLLDAARALPGGYEGGGTPWLLGRLGLYQGDKLGGEARAAYRRLLHGLLLPRLMLRLEERLRRGADPDELYATLKTYLMLGDPAHYDAAAIERWVTADWEQSLPRSLGAAQRQALRAHLAALLAQRPTPLPIAQDASLIADARGLLRQTPLAQRVYGRLKRENPGGVPDFRISEAAGRAAPLVFVRRSGRPLSDGIPGLYTYAGFHRIFAGESERLIGELGAESWVLGAEAALDEATRQALADEVLRLYLEDYARRWEDLLADVQLAPFTSLAQAVELLNVLSGPDSPLRLLLQAVERETSLTREEPGQPAAAGQSSSLGALRQRLTRLVGAAGPGQPVEGGAYIEERFRALHELVRKQGEAAPPLERTLALLNELYAHLNAIASAADRGAAALQAALQQGGGEVIARLKTEASRQPAPLNGLLTTLAEGSESLTLGGVRSHLNGLWSAEVVPFCRQAINGRYPLVPGSSREITLEDFGQMFGPGGRMDSFFQKYLLNFVDTARTPWRWRAAGGNELGLSPAALAAFQRAAAIKEAFFRGGGQSPVVRFTLSPLSMDPEIDQFLLDLDGQQVSYSHGPARPTALQWPGPNGPTQVQIQITPPAPTGRSGVTLDGPWAWFRLLEQARIEPAGQPERFFVTFDVDGRRIRYELRAGSAINPFRLPELERFQCPERL